MNHISFQITGESPLLMHSPAGMRPRTDSLGKKSIPTPDEEAASYVDRLPDGGLFIRTMGFRMGVLYAATGRRIGKRSAPSVVSAALFTTQAQSPLVHPESGKAITDYVVDIQRAVVQRQGIMRARPRIDEWACQVGFAYDADFLTPEWISELMVLAGKISGMGDYRPQKKGTFGRYRVATI